MISLAELLIMNSKNGDLVGGGNIYLEFVRAVAPEKAMAPHSSTLAWKIPWTEEPGGLQSIGLLRVGHD